MCSPERHLSSLARPSPDHRPALRADEVFAGEPDGPAEASGLGDDLIEGVHRFRPADPRDRLHLRAALEQLHAERDRAQLQQPLEVGGEPGPVGVHGGISRRSFGNHVNLGSLG